MSLSSQYLEELSKRYKKQVEELQQSFTKTILAIEEHNSRNIEREQRSNEETRRLRENLAELTERINNFENLVIFIGGFVMIQVIFLFLLIKYCSRSGPGQQESEIELEQNENVYLTKKKSSKKRRRSLSDICEQLLQHEHNNSTQVTYEDFRVTADGETKQESRKKVKNRRKNSAPVLMQQQLKKRHTVSPLMSVDENHSTPNSRPKLTRTESAPPKTFATNFDEKISNSSARNVEQPLLEDNDEFIIPSSSDLSVYGMNNTDKLDVSSQVSNDSIKTNTSYKLVSKARRLSSPTFLKSALSRKGSKKESKEKAEKTNWEWYKISKSSSSNEANRRKAKSESPPRTDLVNGNGNGDEEKLANGEVKKSNSSFRKFFKKVF